MSHAGDPDVSVIIAAWNAADLIEASIRSALDQTGLSVEVIVVDDASPDATRAAAMAVAPDDPRLVCERLDTNSGPSGARNRAIALSRGQFIAVLDADDTMEPGRLSHMVEVAKAKNADIVVDNLVRVVPSDTGVLDGPGTPFLMGPRSANEGVITLADYMDPAVNAAFGGGLGFLKPLIRTQMLRQTGVTYDTSLRNSEDYYLIAHLLAEGAVMTFTPTTGYRYTIREGSLSHRLNPDLIQRIVDAEEAFQARYGQGFSRDAQSAAHRRMSQLKNNRDFERVVAAMKARRPGGFVSAVAKAGPSLGFIGKRLSEIAVAKAFGRADPASR